MKDLRRTSVCVGWFELHSRKRVATAPKPAKTSLFLRFTSADAVFRCCVWLSRKFLPFLRFLCVWPPFGEGHRCDVAFFPVKEHRAPGFVDSCRQSIWARYHPPAPADAPLPPCVTFRQVSVSLRGPGQSPSLPFACCVGSLRSDGRCGRCSCWCCFRVRGAHSMVCWGCPECGGMCRLVGG